MDCYLAPLLHDKMVTKLQMISLNVIHEAKFVYFDIFSLKPAPYGAINENTSLV